MGDFVLKAENVSKVFPLQVGTMQGKDISESGHWALNNVSFEIKKGDRVGIIGSNGSGKSTLLKILAGVTKPSSGKIVIKGKLAGILDIGAGFHLELSGRENIYLNGQIHGFSQKEIDAVFDQILSFSEIGKFIDEPVKNYSNGMYLRLAFSIMTHLDFDIYLLDEVLSVGDIKFRAKCTQKLRQLSQSGKTFIFVSHQLTELEDCNHFLVMQNGRIIKKSRNSDELVTYVEYSLKKREQVFYGQNIEIVDFDEKNIYDDVKLVSVLIYQDSAYLTTSKELNVEIVYDKVLKTGTLDVVLVLQDLLGDVVLSTSPVAGGKVSKEKLSGRYKANCKIPASFFVSKPYKVTVRFIRDLDFILTNPNEQVVNGMHINPTFSDILIFKPVYENENKGVDLAKINFKYNLFLGLEWS